MLSLGPALFLAVMKLWLERFACLSSACLWAEALELGKGGRFGGLAWCLREAWSKSALEFLFLRALARSADLPALAFCSKCELPGRLGFGTGGRGRIGRATAGVQSKTAAISKKMMREWKVISRQK